MKVNNQEKKSEHGSILVLFAVFFSLIMISMALAFDLGFIVSEKSRLQNIADASALASAPELLDEDILRGTLHEDQSDDISMARDYAELYANYNITGFQVERNDTNEIDGGIVMGHINDPNNLSDAFTTTGVDSYNSVQVTIERTTETNGLLNLFLGAFTGLDQVPVQAKAVATIEDRISGFASYPGGSEPILPMAIYEDAWDEAFDGVSDFDQYSYDPNTGNVTNGSDGIPEITVVPWFPKRGIPGKDGNGRTMFITDTISAEKLQEQINNGMSHEDLTNSIIDSLELEDNGFGDYTKWVPGDDFMTVGMHSALNAIQGEKRIVALFRNISDTGPETVPYPEAEWYELTGFQAVVVCESFWPEQEKLRRVNLQPTQMNVESAITNPNVPSTHTVYAFSLTR